MLINGIDLRSLGIQLYNRVLNSNKVDTMEDWMDGDIQPTSIRQQDRFKNIKLDFKSQNLKVALLLVFTPPRSVRAFIFNTFSHFHYQFVKI